MKEKKKTKKQKKKNKQTSSGHYIRNVELMSCQSKLVQTETQRRDEEKMVSLFVKS